MVMKLLFAIIFGFILLFGCTTTKVPDEPTTPVVEPPEEPVVPTEPVEEPTESTTCEEYCLEQPHIECVGAWNISGEYPDCNCSYVCDVVEPEDDDLDVDDLVQPSDKTVGEMLNDGLDKVRLDFYRENDGSFEETRYTWKRGASVDHMPGEIGFDLAPLTDVKFDGKTITDLQGVGFAVFNGTSKNTKALGVIVVLDKMSILDDYTGSDAFDVEYFPSVDHRNFKDCWVYSKDFSKNMESEWVSTYFVQCEAVFSLED